jgi:hypothetical protein
VPPLKQNLGDATEAYDKCAGRGERLQSDADFANVKPKYIKTACGKNDALNKSASGEAYGCLDTVTNQLQTLQRALKSCHSELKSQRDELKA